MACAYAIPGASGAPQAAGKAARLAVLRARIRALEGIGEAGVAEALPLGPAAIDAALPDGGLPLARLHEVAGAAAAPDHWLARGAATGFAAALLARLVARRNGPVLWVAGDDPPYPPGLAALGLPPDRLIMVQARRAVDRLWAVEEAARAGAPLAVLGEVERLDQTASRRLQLAAESGGVTVLLLRRAGAGRDAGAAGVAVTRWQVDAAPGRPARLADGGAAPGVGAPVWDLALRRCRGGRPGDWRVTWGGPQDGFILVAAPDSQEVPQMRLAANAA